MSSAVLGMPSIPSSPSSPNYKTRHRLSNFDLPSASPSPYTSNGTTHSRQSSRTSMTTSTPSSPYTARRKSHHLVESRSISICSQQDFQNSAGLGNLADELGDIWDEDDANDQESGFLNGLREDSIEPASEHEHAGPVDQDVLPDLLLRDAAQSELACRSVSESSQSGRPMSTGHERQPSSLQHSDYETHIRQLDHWPPGLSQQIREIGMLSEEDSISNSSTEAGAVISRTTTSLKDLGPQSSIENGVTRLVTAYTSMATHRTHKRKELLSQSHTLLCSPFLHLPEEVLDMLVSCVEDLIDSQSTSQGQHSSFVSLRGLIASTDDLIRSLQSVSDVLQESRIMTSTAGRKLKSVKDLVSKMRKEEEAKEQGMQWIEGGNWDRRLRSREAQKMCRDVVTGFEKTCDMWRDRLTGGLGEVVG